MNNLILKKLRLLPTLLNQQSYKALLAASNEVLEYNPNNSELLNFKFQALRGLKVSSEDIGFLRKLCWYSSTRAEYFDYLASAYEATNDMHSTLLSLIFAISIEDTSKRRSILSQALKVTSFTSIKLYFLTANRIGHLTCEPDALLRMCQDSESNDGIFRLFICTENVCNEKLLTLLERRLTIVKSDFFHRLQISRRLLLADEFYDTMPYDLASGNRLNLTIDAQINSLCSVYNRFPRTVYLEESDFLEIQEEVENLGILLDSPFVCLHIRDSAYLSALLPERDCSYHSMRDASIEFYEGAIKYLLERGYQVLRVGKETNQVLSVKLPGYYDLSGKITDSLELVLYDKCSFFLGTNSGPFGTAAMFDVPSLLVNCAPAVNFYSRMGRTISKPLRRNGHPVSFGSIVSGETLSSESDVKIRDCYNADELAKHGLYYDENSAQEILAAVIEFVALIESGKESFEKFGRLQQRFLNDTPICGAYRGQTIPTESFLRKNQQSYGLFIEEDNK